MSKVEIVSILDASGSMSRGIEQVRKQFNTFVAEQKEVDGEAFMTMVQFDGMCYEKYMHKPLSDVPKLTSKNYGPGGNTALWDAIGKTSLAVNDRLNELSEDERPSKVVVLIFTDGEENASREFSQDAVREIIKSRQSDGWTYLYFGAGEQAFNEGIALGISEDHLMRQAEGAAGVADGYREASKAVTRGRLGGNFSLK